LTCTLLFPPKESKLASWRQQHQAEVHKIDGWIKALDGLLAGYPLWLSTVRDIHSSLASHTREQEDDMFPSISNAWRETHLKRAGTELEEMESKKRKERA
jgi:hypothetical protein